MAALVVTCSARLRYESLITMSWPNSSRYAAFIRTSASAASHRRCCWGANSTAQSASSGMFPLVKPSVECACCSAFAIAAFVVSSADVAAC